MTDASNLNQSQNFDAQQASEAISQGEQKSPHVNVEADYEASKQFSVSDIDRSGEGSQAAEKATAPQLKVPQPEEHSSEATSTADPQSYREMAKDINPAAPKSPDSDNLVQKAVEKGKPAQ